MSRGRTPSKEGNTSFRRPLPCNNTPANTHAATRTHLAPSSSSSSILLGAPRTRSMSTTSAATLSPSWARMTCVGQVVRVY